MQMQSVTNLWVVFAIILIMAGCGGVAPRITVQPSNQTVTANLLGRGGGIGPPGLPMAEGPDANTGSDRFKLHDAPGIYLRQRLEI